MFIIEKTFSFETRVFRPVKAVFVRNEITMSSSVGYWWIFPLCHFFVPKLFFCIQRRTASNHCVHLSMQKVRLSLYMSKYASRSVCRIECIWVSWSKFVCMPVCLNTPVCMAVGIHVCLFVYLYFNVNLSVLMFVYISVCHPINNLHSQRSVAGDFVNRKTQPSLGTQNWPFWRCSHAKKYDSFAKVKKQNFDIFMSYFKVTFLCCAH